MDNSELEQLLGLQPGTLSKLLSEWDKSVKETGDEDA